MNADDMFAQLRALYDRIRFAEIIREEARRTVVVPGAASAVKLEAWLIAHGLDDVITVQMSPYLPPDTWVVMDVQAIEAGTAEALQALARQPLVLESRCCPRCDWPVGTGRSPTCMVSRYAWGMHINSPSALIRFTGA